MITFSRGGLFSAIISLVFAVVISYLVSPIRAKEFLRIGIGKIFILILVLGLAYIQINSITGGALEKRYTNHDQYGNQIKEDYSTKRVDILLDDLEVFKNNMLIGAGIGGGRIYREEKTGISAAHVEYSRILAEHGLLGILILLIIFLYPLYHFIKVSDVVTRFTFLVFISYALLTMSHNALRLALPSFFYGFGFIIVSWRYYNQQKDSR
jgi:O-antigen ligase